MGADRLLALCALLLASVSANAVVRYEFQAFSSYPLDGAGNGEEIFTGGFVVETPAVILPPASFAPSALVSCTLTGSVSGAIPCGNQEFLDFAPPYVTIGFSGPTFSIFYYFASNAFSTNGVHDTVLFGSDQAGRLTVTGAGRPPAVVPEPASWAMLIAGFGLVGLSLRRRQASFA